MAGSLTKPCDLFYGQNLNFHLSTDNFSEENVGKLISILVQNDNIFDPKDNIDVHAMMANAKTDEEYSKIYHKAKRSFSLKREIHVSRVRYQAMKELTKSN